MSRFRLARSSFLALSLVTSLSTAALANPSMKFASAPPSTSVSNGVAEMPARFDPDIDRAVRLDRSAIRAKLAQNRAANLARFRVYQKKGTFPNNTYRDGKLNVWLDAFGNLCAAATIIKLSGHDDLVQQVASDSNFIRLADVRQGPLMSWILTSGLTQAEIAAIQEPMMRVSPQPTTNGPVLTDVDDDMTDVDDDVPAVDARLRRIEDRRLMTKYKQVEARILKNRRASLDAATDRLMKNPTLALQFLES